MQLITWLPLLVVLFCPIVMGIMMGRMNKNMDDRHMYMKSDDSAHVDHMNESEALNAK